MLCWSRPLSELLFGPERRSDVASFDVSLVPYRRELYVVVNPVVILEEVGVWFAELVDFHFLGIR